LAGDRLRREAGPRPLSATTLRQPSRPAKLRLRAENVIDSKSEERASCENRFPGFREPRSMISSKKQCKSRAARRGHVDAEFFFIAVLNRLLSASYR
jgi:hypothetical protein